MVAFEATESLPERDLTRTPVDGQTTVAAGTQANVVLLGAEAMMTFVEDITRRGLWDERYPSAPSSEVLLASPWGFRWISTASEFAKILPAPMLDFRIDEADLLPEP